MNSGENVKENDHDGDQSRSCYEIEPHIFLQGIHLLHQIAFYFASHAFHFVQQPPLKNKIDLLVCKNLEEQLTIINSAKMNLFNATAPITMASVLNAPRIGELGKWINTLYGSDHLLYDNVEFFDEFDILTPEPKSLKK